jgi:hypothetical protein
MTQTKEIKDLIKQRNDQANKIREIEKRLNVLERDRGDIWQMLHDLNDTNKR